MKAKIYNLNNKRILAELLGLNLKQLNYALTGLEKRYNVFHIGPKKRQVEQPIGLLEQIHRGIKYLLDEIELPTYVHSGKRKHSYSTNAKAHLGSSYIETMDIKSFYRSCNREYIFRFFHYDLLNASDVAWCLTDLITYNGYLPTGSPTSQLIAFLSNRKLFDEINDMVIAKGGVFTLFVDDLTFSSTVPFEDGFLSIQVKRILKRQALKTKRSKIRKYSKVAAEITGAIVAQTGKLKAPNWKRRPGSVSKLAG